MSILHVFCFFSIRTIGFYHWQVFTFGSVPVARFRVPTTSTTAPDADIRTELFRLGLSSRDCHEFAMPW
jgi:hypothetical protein